MIATHEAGHATVAWLVGRGRTLDVLSIVKRKEALGLLAHSDAEERFTRTKSEMRALIQIAMGGMAAEELFFGESSSGVGERPGLRHRDRLSDGRGPRHGVHAHRRHVRRPGPVRPTSTAKVLANDAARDEVEHLLARSKAEARTMLKQNRHVVEALRDALLEPERAGRAGHHSPSSGRPAPVDGPAPAGLADRSPALTYGCSGRSRSCSPVDWVWTGVVVTSPTTSPGSESWSVQATPWLTAVEAIAHGACPG